MVMLGGEFKHDGGCDTTLNGHYDSIKIAFVIPIGQCKQVDKHLLQTIYATYNSKKIYFLSMFLIASF